MPAQLPENPEAAASMIDRVAAQAMGVAPTPTGSAPTQPTGSPAPNAQAPKKDTPEAQVQKAMSPDTAADKMSANPVTLKVPMKDGSERDFTPEQITGLLDRYSSLNFKHSQLAPVMSVIEKYMASNPNATPAQIANQLQDLSRASQHNAQFGAQADPTNQNGFDPNALKKWEEDNAATLPPGYREMMQQFTGMAQAMQQQQQMMRMMMAQSSGVADAARQTHQNAQSQQIDATRRTIASNLDRVQQALNLPDEAAEDFNVWASERGYTMEDFIDPQLTIKVMQDFAASRATPEMERLRQIAQRRSAVMGGMGVTPTQGGAPAAAAGADPTFDAMAQFAMNKRGI